MLVKMADHESIEELTQEFQRLDKDQTGMLSADDLKSAFKATDIDISA